MKFYDFVSSGASLSANIDYQGVSIAKAMLISFSGGPDESSLSEGVGRKRNSGLLAALLLDNSALQGPRGERQGTSERSARRNPERFHKFTLAANVPQNAYIDTSLPRWG